jgi:TetR/AcrR family transcriptional regulator, lmrAB and yxaGH operons repressor
MSRARAAHRTQTVPAKERMLATAADLLQRQGYHGTGLAEVLAESGAPRGSMYFHFPGGKEQLACEALRASGDRWKARIAKIVEETKDPSTVIVRVCEALGDELEASGYRLGCPVATVALEAAGDSEKIRQTCSEHFASWETLVAAHLERNGAAPEAAKIAATVTLASVEGALLLARVYKSKAPLERVALALSVQLPALLRR